MDDQDQDRDQVLKNAFDALLNLDADLHDLHGCVMALPMHAVKLSLSIERIRHARVLLGKVRDDVAKEGGLIAH